MNQDIIFISQRLKEKCIQLCNANFSVIDAPAGYGKSTAVLYAMQHVPSTNKHFFIADQFHKFYENDLYYWF